MTFISLALPYTTQRTLHLLHIFPRATNGLLKPHNFHRLHRLGYRVDWQPCFTEGIPSESVMLTIPPRRSVYRDIVEQDVGSRQDNQHILWSNEWGLISRKVLNPYLCESNTWSAALLHYQTDIGDICLEFRDLNETGRIKGPFPN